MQAQLDPRLFPGLSHTRRENVTVRLLAVFGCGAGAFFGRYRRLVSHRQDRESAMISDDFARDNNMVTLEAGV